jgi:hypothetical protein
MASATNFGTPDWDSLDMLAQGGLLFQKALVIVSATIPTTRDTVKSIQIELALKRRPLGETKVSLGKVLGKVL